MLIGITEDPLETIVAFNVSSNLSSAEEGDAPAGEFCLLRFVIRDLISRVHSELLPAAEGGSLFH